MHLSSMRKLLVTPSHIDQAVCDPTRQGGASLASLSLENTSLKGAGTAMESRDMPEASDPGLEPSPLMKWTSDGSMMEELLKSLNPGSQQPAPQGEIPLVKDASISSTLLALIAQQEEENVAADREARAGYHHSQSETLVHKNNTDSSKPSIKSEESGWMPASFVDGHLVRPGNGAAMSSNAIVSGGCPDAALSMPAAVVSTGTRPQEGVSLAILPSKLLMGHNPQANQLSRLTSVHVPLNVAVQQASAQPPANDVHGRTTNPRQAPVEDMTAYPAGALQEQSQRALDANPLIILPRPRYLHGGQESEQGLGYPSTSLPTRVHQGTYQEVAQNYGSASLPSASYQRSSIDQQAHMQTSHEGNHVVNNEKDLLSLDSQTDGHHQMLAFLGNMGRAASAHEERLRPDVREFPVKPRTPLEQGSELQAMYTQAGEVGSQLAAEYMREAEQTSRNSYMISPAAGGLPPAQTATATLSAACLDGATLHASSAPHFMAGSQQFNNFSSGPPSVADLVVEPPAILTADLRSIAGRLPEQQTGLSHPIMGPGNATPSDRIASRAKRDRNVRAAKPPVGLKRSAVGPPPARAVSTDVDEKEEHSAEAETGPWEDTHMEDREAKKQLRKEKNRASAAASRARREAYTASLEEEVARLKEGRNWLEGQVNAPGHAMPLSLATRAPVRHLSI